MTQEQIKQAVDKYFKEMLQLDKNYVDNVTDSWVDDAENWFLAHNNNVTFEEVCEFRQTVHKKFDEIYDEQFGTRDALLRLHVSIQKLKLLRSDFERDKKFFKIFSIYDNVVSTDFANLLEHINLLNDIEEGKIESLKEKRK